ncbi:MAG: LysE family transporter [Saprospiraceae bacterium]
MDWFLKGCLLGISIGLLIGPLFFALIHSAMQLGIKKAIVLALGTWISDFSLLLVSYFLMSKMVLPKNTSELQPIVIIICSAFFILAGLFTFLNKTSQNADQEVSVKFLDLWHLFLKGFLINTLNPAAIFIWIGLATMIRNLNTGFEEIATVLFYLGVVSMIISLDVAKIYLGKFISGKLKLGVIEKIKWVSGSAFIISGLLLLLKLI